ALAPRDARDVLADALELRGVAAARARAGADLRIERRGVRGDRRVERRLVADGHARQVRLGSGERAARRVAVAEEVAARFVETRGECVRVRMHGVLRVAARARGE